jgi:hypothetical protein|tara:strand:+ start:1175 stop:1582 length:408 start_codon:yes stop_codon:yes gene_type:complete
MIEKIYSKVDKKLILFSAMNIKDVSDGRIDSSPEKEYLQSSISNLKKGFQIKPHKHKSFERKIYKTQEAWFLYEGKIVAEFFDIDNKKVAERVFKKGDLISIFNGGHCFQITENSIFLEFKNGPYFGKEIDREDI